MSKYEGVKKLNEGIFKRLVVGVTIKTFNKMVEVVENSEKKRE